MSQIRVVGKEALATIFLKGNVWKDFPFPIVVVI